MKEMPAAKKIGRIKAENADQFMMDVEEAFGGYYDDRVESNNERSLHEVAKMFNISAMKVRKILITRGCYTCEKEREISRLILKGHTLSEIKEIMAISMSSVTSYIPYKKSVYNLSNADNHTSRTRKYRVRKAARENLQKALESKADTNKTLKNALWECMSAYDGYLFHSLDENIFSITMKNRSVFLERVEEILHKEDIWTDFCSYAEQKKSGVCPIIIENPNYLIPIFQCILPEEPEGACES